jgi:hypothetical protein
MKRVLTVGVVAMMAFVVGCQSCPKQTCLPVVPPPPCPAPVSFGTPVPLGAPVFESAPPALAQPKAAPAPKQILPSPILQPTTQGFEQEKTRPVIRPERIA